MSYITDVDYDIIMHPEKFKFDDYKVIDIENAGAGSLCAILSSHLRLSHGDYNDPLFRNTEDVRAAYREVKACPNVDVEDFIRNYS